MIDGRLTVLVGDERIEAGPGDFVFGPMGVPHAFLVTSERAETLITFSPADPGTPGLSGGRFLSRGRCPRGSRPRPAAARQADREELARLMMPYGIETVGPPPTLD